MKLVSFNHLVGNGFKNIWLNKLMSFASIGVLVACMSVIGIATAVSVNISNALNILEKENVALVYFNDRNSAKYGGTDSTVTDTQISEDDYVVKNVGDAIRICAEISKLDNVDTVTFISSDQALENAKSSMTDTQASYLSFLDDEQYGNPLSHSARVSMKDLEFFDETIENISEIEGVDSIRSQNDLAAKMTAIKQALSIVGFWIIVILMVISLVIVSNTIRVTMYNRKLEISIMKAVGATDNFIRLPFLVEGVSIGIISALLTSLIIYFVYQAVMKTIMNTLNLSEIVPFGKFALPLMGVFILIGVLAGVFSSLIMITKYLRKEGSEFRAL